MLSAFENTPSITCNIYNTPHVPDRKGQTGSIQPAYSHLYRHSLNQSYNILFAARLSFLSPLLPSSPTYYCILYSENYDVLLKSAIFVAPPFKLSCTSPLNRSRPFWSVSQFAMVSRLPRYPQIHHFHL